MKIFRFGHRTVLPNLPRAPNLSDMDLRKRIVNGVLAVKVTPKASSERIVLDGAIVRVYVTAPPDKGKANEVVRVLLARELGLPKSALTLVRGTTSRDKVFSVDL